MGVFYLAPLLCGVVVLRVCLPQYYIIRSCMLWFYVRGKDSCSFLAKACSILGGVHFLLYGLFVPEYIVVTLDIRIFRCYPIVVGLLDMSNGTIQVGLRWMVVIYIQ